MLGSDYPSDGDILSCRDGASSSFVQAVGRTAVHTQLLSIHCPVEDHLVGGVGDPKIGRVGLGDNCDLDGRLECARCAEPIRALQDNTLSTHDGITSYPRRALRV